MDAISNSAKVEANSGKASMEASSPISASVVSLNTTKTSKLTPELILEILGDILAKCQQSGIDIRCINHENNAIVILDNVKLEEGRFVPLNI